MKIVYWCNWNNQFNNKIEEAIAWALRQEGHRVKVVDEKNWRPEQIIDAKADLLLFFKGAEMFGHSADQLAKLLDKVPYTKVFWYFDKVWGARVEWMYKIIPKVDLGFLTDETFIRSHNYFNIYPLKQGLDERAIKKGKKRKEFEVDVAFTGTIYGKREPWARVLRMAYGERFKVFHNVFDDDLNDLCASAKIMVAPLYPSDHYYWSARVYETVGRGGFLIHPELEGLKKEFQDGKHLVFYRNHEDMLKKIDYYLDKPKERAKIVRAGMAHCKKHHTYRHAVKQLFETL